jgi:peptidyl-prolyl cis-trans isomerase A (cyclophilin A)
MSCLLMAASAGLLAGSSPLSRRYALCAAGSACFFGSREATAAAEPPYRVAMTILLDPSNPATTSQVVIEVMPEWAPLAAARFKELIDIGFYTRSRFHRVLPLYVAQFGVSTNRELNTAWLCKTCKRLPDEPRLQSNKKGTLSFAQASVKDTRQTQVFFNLVDNGGLPNFLDSQGFTPFARVISGMDTVEKLYNGYGIMESASGGMAGAVSVNKAAYYGEAYLDEVFPKLSIIESVKLLKLL